MAFAEIQRLLGGKRLNAFHKGKISLVFTPDCTTICDAIAALIDRGVNIIHLKMLFKIDEDKVTKFMVAYDSCFKKIFYPASMTIFFKFDSGGQHG